MTDVAAIQAQLCRREIGEAQLKTIAEEVARLTAGGFPAKDVFPLGIIVQDGAGVVFEVQPDSLGKLVDEIAKLKDLKPEIKIFPKGILAPDTFEVRTSFGRGNG